MAERVYLSIGEVLSLLQAEFPDVTISKIRFLESQGLLDPERTPSGYRKFYQTDVERLRWILQQQRENFLPLKVIKGRLLGGRQDGDSDGDGEGEGSPSGPAANEPAGAAPPALKPVGSDPLTTETAVIDPVAAPSVIAEPATQDPVTVEPEPVAIEPVAIEPVAIEPAVDPEPPVRQAPRHQPPRRRLSVTDLPLPLSGASLTLEELASASGQSPDYIRDLERAGFITGRSVADVVYYDEESLSVAELMGGFARFGIEPRHLRIYKNSAEREAGLFQQVIVPLLKQRNPEARQRAIDALEELSQLGERLRTTMLRQAIKGLTGG